MIYRPPAILLNHRGMFPHNKRRGWCNVHIVHCTLYISHVNTMYTTWNYQLRYVERLSTRLQISNLSENNEVCRLKKAFSTSTHFYENCSYYFVLHCRREYACKHLRPVKARSGGVVLYQSRSNLDKVNLSQGYCIVRINFSIWRPSVEQVYLGYNYNKSLQCWRLPSLGCRGWERESFVYILAQHPYTICITYFLRNYPMFTVLDLSGMNGWRGGRS